MIAVFGLMTVASVVIGVAGAHNALICGAATLVFGVSLIAALLSFCHSCDGAARRVVSGG